MKTGQIMPFFGSHVLAGSVAPSDKSARSNRIRKPGKQEGFETGMTNLKAYRNLR
jgi:hypothetical protein